jgi:glycosyl transferase family 87
MNPTRRSLLGHPLIAGLLCLWAFLDAAAVIVCCQQRTNQWDFSHYYVSSDAARRGINPYRSDLTPLADRLGLQVNEINRATNPPSFVLTFELLTLLKPNTAYWAWFSINASALAFSLFLLLVDLPLGRPLEAWSLVALVIVYPPIIDNFLFAQVQILIMLLLLGMMAALRRGHDLAAGLLLASASLLRIYPVVIAGYLVVTRRWRALLYTIMFGVIGVLVTACVLGVGRMLSFAQVYTFLTARHWLGVAANVSLNAFVSRVFWLAGPATAGWEMARKIAVAGVDILMLLATVLISLAAGDEDDSQWRFSLWVVVMVLVAPTAWPHYLIFLLIPFSRLLIESRRDRVSPKTARFGLMSAALLFVGYHGASITHIPHPALSAVTAQLLVLSLVLAYISMYSFGADLERLGGLDWRWRHRSIKHQALIGADS